MSTNYLIPVDAEQLAGGTGRGAASRWRTRWSPWMIMLGLRRREPRLQLAILDACRNDPIRTRMLPTSTLRCGRCRRGLGAGGRCWSPDGGEGRDRAWLSTAPGAAGGRRAESGPTARSRPRFWNIMDGAGPVTCLEELFRRRDGHGAGAGPPTWIRRSGRTRLPGRCDAPSITLAGSGPTLRESPVRSRQPTALRALYELSTSDA